MRELYVANFETASKWSNFMVDDFRFEIIANIVLVVQSKGGWAVSKANNDLVLVARVFSTRISYSFFVFSSFCYQAR